MHHLKRAQCTVLRINPSSAYQKVSSHIDSGDGGAWYKVKYRAFVGMYILCTCIASSLPPESRQFFRSAIRGNSGRHCCGCSRWLWSRLADDSLLLRYLGLSTSPPSLCGKMTTATVTPRMRNLAEVPCANGMPIPDLSRV